MNDSTTPAAAATKTPVSNHETPVSNHETPVSNHTTAANSGDKRRRQLLIASGIFALIGTLWFAHWTLVSRFQEETEDAYVQGNIIQVTPQTAGTVVAIYADDTDRVRAGQPLVKLDDTDAQVALAQAEAELAQSVRRVRSLFTSNDALLAQIDLQETALTRARADLKRRSGLSESGAVSSEELHHSEVAVKSAQADLLAAREALAGNVALTENTAIDTHPEVLAASAQLRAAYLNLQRTTIPSPIDGFIAKRGVQLGQRIAPGKPLMAVIPLEQVWVDANFKESQLHHIRIGQPVTLSADMYGKDMEYHGKVVGLDAGTGSAFSLLPPQNATGNWIKVVQRLPVRIALDPEQLKTHPLRLGLSMKAEVDIRDDSGSQLTQASSHPQATYVTRVYDLAGQHADALVDQVIKANAGPLLRAGSAITQAQAD
ncbi:HlyD family efflux transporter periplasmic adaptor subunit [Aestuariicella hydrocarbonica]|uniref:HlyD family efflux transporter periplasmic adaptor subunit n=1 Tax=Pseudomaricurvus hydrocarbonicus TaxID=1470433 RepID=A0A9E5MNX3_9GAMM|nr:efflux RND transporter periplasmic adaptor subunit [Aestuariicella hydrocarbonica]NHO67658.1 HlyD family efflux transporter periplasmic adaptor subunit [Aestuariicella hydrocarbonica]